MKQKIRCAIYTHKSSEDGLELEFNSLDAQREACAAYITSQKAEGWVLLPEEYNDGGISGGTLARPALQRLLIDLDEGRVDQIVVYKIDRLSRSLADFAKIVDRLDDAGASFVSVTQSFNTASSMGRLTLNMLLSFAQFEREVTAERIRDKIATSKCKGLWMGGLVPLGYDPDGRTLTINVKDAKIIQKLYDLYFAHGTVRAVKEKADQLGLRSKRRASPSGEKRGGNPFEHGQIHHILTNPIYAGKIRHRKQVYDGLHPAIIEQNIWENVQKRLIEQSGKSRGKVNTAHPSLLAGKLFDETGDRLTPSHANKNGKRIRYYISRRLVTDKSIKHPDAWRLPAPQLEKVIALAVRERFAVHDLLPRLVEELDANEVNHLKGKIGSLAQAFASKNPVNDWSEFVAKVDIAPSHLSIELDGSAIAKHLELPVKRLSIDALTISTAFRLRRKGVETKIVLGNAPPEIDLTLIHNVVKAMGWFEEIKSGQTFAQIAARAGTSKRRVQDVIDLAFLAPDIIEKAVSGTLPLHFTSDYLIKSGVQADWAAQRKMLMEPAFINV